MSSVNVRLRLPEDSLCELFHTNTKLYPYQFRQWAYQHPPITEHPEIAQWMKSPFKEYLSLPRQLLPKPFLLKTSFEKESDSSELSDMEALSNLLNYSKEITALEIYLCVLEIRGITKGLYHYNKKMHHLESFSETDISSHIGKIRENIPENLTAIIIISGIFPRERLKYGERGYRYMLFETGQLIQQMLMNTEALNLTLYRMPDFFDDAVNELIGADGVEESALYLVGVQKKDEPC